MRSLAIYFGAGIALALSLTQASAQSHQPVVFLRKPAQPTIVVPNGPDCTTPAIQFPAPSQPGMPWQPGLPGQTPMPGQQGIPGQTPTPGQPGMPGAESMPGQDPGANPLAGADQIGGGGPQASLAGTGGGEASAANHMIGDFGGVKAWRVVVIPTTKTVTTSTQPTKTIFRETQGGEVLVPVVVPNGPPIVTSTTTRALTTVRIYDPVASRAGSGFKIADNESPIPQDRVFFTYNYFNNLQGGPAYHAGSASSQTTTTPGGDIVTTDTTFPNTVVGARTANVHREMFGFEKTFFHGNASVGARLPMFQSSGDGSFGSNDIGDVSVIFKYAALRNQETGDVLSIGTVITAPTGAAITTVDGNINSTLIQPFVGYVFNLGDFYVQGFSSAVFPTNNNDVRLLFNDIGFGYRLYRNDSPSAFVTAVVPTVEIHATTPLDHNNSGSLIVPNVLSVTGGVHVGLNDRAWLTIAGSAPVTGPRPYDFEGMVQFNYKF